MQSHPCRYLLNPYSIVTCGGLSTISITNLAMVWAIWMKLRGTYNALGPFSRSSVQLLSNSTSSHRFMRIYLASNSGFHSRICESKFRTESLGIFSMSANTKLPSCCNQLLPVYPPTTTMACGLIPSLQVQISYRLWAWLQLPISPSTQ